MHPTASPAFARLGLLAATALACSSIRGADHQAEPPRADLVMVLDDYRFELSGALARGRRTIEVTTTATQAHEVVFVRLDREDTLAHWIATGGTGTPPGRLIGGVARLEHGERAWLTLDLEPGAHALLCLLPDAQDGRTHAEHGMLRVITVH